MRLKAAIEGSLETYMKAEMKAAERAVLSGVKRASEGLKLEMRRQVTGAGLGRRLANTWRGRVYGNKGIDAAGLGSNAMLACPPKTGPARMLGLGWLEGGQNGEEESHG